MPAPRGSPHRRPAYTADVSFLKKLGSWLSGGAANEPEAETAPEPEHAEPDTADAKTAFAHRVAAIVRDAEELGISDAPLEVAVLHDDFGLAITHADGETSQMYLVNLYAEVQQKPPEERDAYIASFVGTMLNRPELPDTWLEVRDRLLPTVRTSTYFVQPNTVGDCPIVTRPFAPGLVEAVAIDFDETLSYATHDQLESWGLDVAALFERAYENLAPRADDGVEPYDPDAVPPIFCVSSNDSYESSRIALPGWLASFRDRVGGRPIAAIPDRAMLLVTRDDPDAIARLSDAADGEFRHSPRAISPVLYTVTDGGAVVPLQIEGELGNTLHQRHAAFIQAEYDAQRAALEEYFETEDAPRFPAQQSIAVRESDDRYISYCIWSSGVPTLLPVSDVLVLSWPDGDSPFESSVLPVHFDVARRLLADCFSDGDCAGPERIFAEHWPSDEKIAELAEHGLGGLDEW